MSKIAPPSQVSPVRRRTRVSPSAPPPPAEEPETGNAGDYAVGYGRPPVHTQFKQGTSGNPRGRPRGATALKTLVREMMNGRVSVRTTAGVTKMTRIEALLHKVFELGLKGNPRAQACLLNLYSAAVPEGTDQPSGGGDERDDGVLRLQQLSEQFLVKALARD